MTAKNDITGDAIATRMTTENYRNNYDAIFGKKESSKVCDSCSTCENAECNNAGKVIPILSKV